MNVPRDKAGDELKQAVRSLAENARAFQVFMSWIRTERDTRRRENDHRGHENTSTEAEALTTILDFVETATTNPANAKSANGEAGGVI